MGGLWTASSFPWKSLCAGPRASGPGDPGSSHGSGCHLPCVSPSAGEEELWPCLKKPAGGGKIRQSTRVQPAPSPCPSERSPTERPRCPAACGSAGQRALGATAKGAPGGAPAYPTGLLGSHSATRSWCCLVSMWSRCPSLPLVHVKGAGKRHFPGPLPHPLQLTTMGC